MRAKSLIKKIDTLWRETVDDEAGSFDKVDRKDEVLNKSPRAKKLIRAKESKLDRQFGGAKLLARKLRELP